MRICLYVGKAPAVEQQSEWLANAKSTSDVYARNLHSEFTKRGHEVVFASSFSAKPRAELTPEAAEKRLARFAKLTYPPADHAICLEQHGFKNRERVFFDNVRAVTSGLVCSICDKDYEVGPEDRLFTARRPIFHPDKARYVGWAADPDVFTPEKDPDWLTIFVDHKSNAHGRYDDTEALLKSATRYAAALHASGELAGDPPRRVRVVFFSPEGLEVIAPGEVRDVDLGDDPRSFYKRVPGPELAGWIRKTDIFVVTHGESMGLPVLESAMAGALVVAGRGYIKPELLRSLGHFEYDRVEDIDWGRLADSLDPAMFRRRSLHFTWADVAERMLESLEGESAVPAASTQRNGTWMIKQPAPLFDREFGLLSSWSARQVRIEHSGATEVIHPTGDGKSNHYLRHDLRKNPWPETFTLSFRLKGDGVHNLRLWFCGENTHERTEVHLDLQALTAREHKPKNGWAFIDGNVVQLEDEALCQLVVLSDWAPIMRCYMLLTRGDDLRFDADDEHPGIAISQLHLARGVPLAMEARDRPAGSTSGGMEGSD